MNKRCPIIFKLLLNNQLLEWLSMFFRIKIIAKQSYFALNQSLKLTSFKTLNPKIDCFRTGEVFSIEFFYLFSYSESFLGLYTHINIKKESGREERQRAWPFFQLLLFEYIRLNFTAHFEFEIHTFSEYRGCVHL